MQDVENSHSLTWRGHRERDQGVADQLADRVHAHGSQKIRNRRPVPIKRGKPQANDATGMPESWVVGEGWGSRYQGTSGEEDCERRAVTRSQQVIPKPSLSYHKRPGQITVQYCSEAHGTAAAARANKPAKCNPVARVRASVVPIESTRVSVGSNSLKTMATRNFRKYDISNVI
jgi:hypothetical protein